MSTLKSAMWSPSPLRQLTRKAVAGRYIVRRQTKRRMVVRAGVDPVDRVLGSVSYLLPLMDGLKYGTYIFNTYPVFFRLVSPVLPLYEVYTNLPFGSLLFFFGVYFGVVRNRSLSRFVRFNAMQAILIDILLMSYMIAHAVGEVRIPVYNVTWIYVFICTAIGIGSCFAGQSARLPLVADASDAQVDR